jgi:predicted enzyme related to lactoylglutathione lyase
MGLIKIYRYRIHPDRVPQFLDIQLQADVLYREHVDYIARHYRSKSDPWQWTEIHTYPTLEMLLKADSLTAQCHSLRDLFAEFLTTLDPRDQTIREEILEDCSIVRQQSTAAPICYVEIPAPDIEKAGSFYSSVFGWEMRPSNLSEAAYWEFRTGDDQISGGLVQGRTAHDVGVLLYIKVKDIDSILRVIAASGGTIAMPKTDIGGGHGASALFIDPNGNRIGLISSM